MKANKGSLSIKRTKKGEALSISLLLVIGCWLLVVVVVVVGPQKIHPKTFF